MHAAASVLITSVTVESKLKFSTSDSSEDTSNAAVSSGNSASVQPVSGPLSGEYVLLLGGNRSLPISSSSTVQMSKMSIGD